MTITSFSDTTKTYETTEQAEAFLSLKAQYDVRNQPQALYSEVCGHLVRKDVTKHCGCMA